MPPGRRPVTRGQNPRNAQEGRAYTPVTPARPPMRGPYRPGYTPPANPWASTPAQRDAFVDSRNAGDVLGPTYTDPLGDMTPWDALMGMWDQAGQDGPGGGGRGGGGSGGSAAANPADPDPHGWAAIAAAEARKPLYEQQLAAIQGKLDADNTGFNQRQGQLGSLRDQGSARTAAIMGELAAQLGSTQQGVAGAYAGGDQALAGLQQSFGAGNQARNAGAGQTLSAFGVDPNAGAVSVDPLIDMLVASRAMNTNLGTNAQASLAGRNQVYAGLGADANMQQGAGYDRLTAQLQAEQQKAAAQAASDRANMLLQQQAAELAAQQAEQARRASYVK